MLTFLLLRRACAPEGVILLDEPELHLNPSVTRRVVPFLIRHILEVTPSQAVICTHSHEIIADAYNRDDCTLLHLRSGSVISLVRRQDRAEIQDVLKRLGIDTPDVLSGRGTLFVEGKEDLDLLEIGFPERVGGYRIVPLGGRGEIEREIRALQAKEEQIESPQCFIFDLDNKPSGLGSTAMVRVGQWDRYCFENYLLEDVCIFDALATIPAANKPLSVGEVRPLLKELALSQVPLEVVRQAYESYRFENAGFRRGIAESAPTYEEAAEALSKVVEVAKQSLAAIDLKVWRREFVARCQSEDARMRPEWDEKWRKRADGKRLLGDLHRHIQAKISPSELKKRIMLEVARAKAPSWREVDSLLGEVIPARAS